MTDTLRTTLLMFIGGIIAIIPGILAWITSARVAKRQAELEKIKLPIEMKSIAGDAADKVSAGYDRLVDNLQARIKDVEARLTSTEDRLRKEEEITASQEKRIAYLESGVSRLVAQIKGLSVEPVFDLDEVGN